MKGCEGDVTRGGLASAASSVAMHSGCTGAREAAGQHEAVETEGGGAWRGAVGGCVLRQRVACVRRGRGWVWLLSYGRAVRGQRG